MATIIIGRELLIMGLRGLVAADGAVMKPSIWGKLKTNVQFVAILIAIVYPDISIGPWRISEWAMFVAALITVASAVEYLARFWPVLTANPGDSGGMSKVLITGATGFVGGAVCDQLLDAGRDVRVLSRDPSAAEGFAERGPRW